MESGDRQQHAVTPGTLRTKMKMAWWISMPGVAIVFQLDVMIGFASLTRIPFELVCAI
jgi:hypothetical protein